MVEAGSAAVCALCALLVLLVDDDEEDEELARSTDMRLAIGTLVALASL